MNRRRNILIWLITAVYFAAAMLMILPYNQWIALGITVIVVVPVAIMMIAKPERMGLAKHTPRVFRATIALESENTPEPVSILINKARFTIGRSEGCNYTIRGNKKLSKRHISILYNPGDRSHKVIDHDTTNGTMLNRMKLIPGEEKIIHIDDTIEMAGITFRVKSASS